MRHLIAASLLGFAGLSAYAQGRSQSHLDYFATYAPMAVAEMQTHGIPASITLAQGLLESGAGKSSLAAQSNNHFGIKCPGGWTGATHHAKDDDYRNGRLVKSCFRAYSSAADSYADHSAFLVGSPRYAGLFKLSQDDYRGWARGLKKAGYATSRTYASSLIELIERYELQQYDNPAAGLPLGREVLAANTRPVLSGARLSTPTAPRRSAIAAPTDLIQNVNDVDYAEALPGESVAALASRTGRSVRELTRYNEGLGRGTRLRPRQRVFLQPKRNSYRGKAKRHRLKHSETLQSVADLYGLSTTALRSRNRITSDAEPRPNSQLVIRGKRRKSDVVRVVTSTERQSALAVHNQAPRTRVVAAEPAPRPATRRRVEVIAPAPAPTPVQRHITVAAGDTLYAISRAHGVSVAQLRSANGLSGNTINVGQRLLLNK